VITECTRWCGPHCAGGHCSACHGDPTKSGAHDDATLGVRRRLRDLPQTSPASFPPAQSLPGRVAGRGALHRL
jgi:hypothetical protein